MHLELCFWRTAGLEVHVSVVDLSTHPDPAEGLADVLAHYELMLARLAQALGVPVEPATVR